MHDVYVHIKDGESYDGEIYYIHSNDGLWLLLCFDGETFEDTAGIDTDGRPERYVSSNMTLGSLENAADISLKFTNATIRQLVDAGLIRETSTTSYSNLYTLTFSELLDIANGSN